MNDLEESLDLLLTNSAYNFSRIRVFRRVTLEGPPAASGTIYKEIYGPPEGPNSRLSDDIRHMVAKVLTDRLMTDTQSAVDAATVIFAHSILDDVASECCRISVHADPDAWAAAIKKRQVSIEDIEHRTYAEIRDHHLGKYVGKLSRESLVKRLDLLNQRCRPVPPFYTQGIKYDYAIQRIKDLDILRQAIIHRVTIFYGQQPMLSLDTDLAYFYATCRFLMFMVSEHHKIPLRTFDGDQTEPPAT